MHGVRQRFTEFLFLALAFQESVGRLGNFPHGIDILTAADFFSVGLRTNSFLNISDYIAQYDEYTTSLIDHLFEKKIGHWDTAVREITAKALYKLTKRVRYVTSFEIDTILNASLMIYRLRNICPVTFYHQFSGRRPQLTLILGTDQFYLSEKLFYR